MNITKSGQQQELGSNADITNGNVIQDVTIHKEEMGDVNFNH